MAMNQSARRGGVAAISAGGLIAVALLGPRFWDGLWHALAPAAALVILAARELHAAWRPRDGRLGAVASFVLSTGAGSLLALMIIGTAATASRGVEPPWLAVADQIAGFAFLAGAALFGLAMLRARTAPRWAAIVLGVSLPLGLGMDAATNLFPFGELFFFAGSGFYVGLGLFALALIRLGFAVRSSVPIDVAIDEQLLGDPAPGGR